MESGGQDVHYAFAASYGLKVVDWVVGTNSEPCCSDGTAYQRRQGVRSASVRGADSRSEDARTIGERTCWRHWSQIWLQVRTARLSMWYALTCISTMDNGFLLLNKVKIPHVNMLAKYVKSFAADIEANAHLPGSRVSTPRPINT